jgi:hypothetical protein
MAVQDSPKLGELLKSKGKLWKTDSLDLGKNQHQKKLIDSPLDRYIYLILCGLGIDV